MRAVDERVAVAPVGGIEELGETVGARALSGPIAVPARPPALSRIAKPGPAFAGAQDSTATLSTRARARRIGAQAGAISSMRTRSPSTSIVTPCASLRTQPASESSEASR